MYNTASLWTHYIKVRISKEKKIPQETSRSTIYFSLGLPVYNWLIKTSVFITWSRIRADSMRRGQTDFRIKRTSINESPGSTYLAKTYRGQCTWLKMLESSIFRRIDWSWNNILCPLILWQVYKFAILCLFLKIILVVMCLWTKAYTWQERSHITWYSMILLCRFWGGHLAWKEPHDESRYYDNYTAKSISHDVQKDP